MDCNEHITRKEIIDKKLELAGWNVNDKSQVLVEFSFSKSDAVTELKTNYISQFSDYVLLGKNGKPIAVVEAKKTSKDARAGKEQARQYCYDIQKESGDILPFCFYTNGNDIYFWNLEQDAPRKVLGFPTLDDLKRFDYIRSNKKSLITEFIDTNIAGRDYQIQAIRTVLEAIEKNRRKHLLVMATGTGKTRTAIALINSLMKAGRIERTLFLVDRIALREQALENFKEFIPNEPRWPKEGETLIQKDRRIYVSTYPTMLNIIRDETSKLSPHFFDFVVIDESHRSIYNTYGEILKYFNSIVLGLTATPTNVIDHNTFKLFDCEDGLPTFAYSYEEAVNHEPPYLCRYQVMKLQTKFQTDGISKRTISLEDQKKMLLTGQEVAEINFEGTDLEKKVTNKGTNKLIIQEFMKECIKSAEGTIPGKTIFFCMTIAHARRMEDLFNSMYPEHNGNLAKVIVSDDSRVYGKNGLLSQFKKENMPRIALSVGMLDTGVDIREVVNLVFAKPVYSYTRFWQMIGRGTRLLEKNEMKPWCLKKDTFLILDCWDNFEYFKENPEGKDFISSIPLPVQLFEARLQKIEKAMMKSKPDIVRNELERLQKQLDLLPINSIEIQDSLEKINSLKSSEFWQSPTFQEIESIRNEIKPLFKTVTQANFKEMRFEKDVLDLSFSLLTDDKTKAEAQTKKLIEKIEQFPLDINTVAKEKELIEKVKTKKFWKQATENDLYNIVEKLAPFTKFINDTTKNGFSELNFRDVIKTKEYVEFGPEMESVSIAKYREMVERKIYEMLQSNDILQKIKQGLEVNEQDAKELAEQLFEEHPNITVDLLRKVYKNRKAKFLQFIKHILGIEILTSFPEKVSTAIDEFLKNHNYLNQRQIEFINLLRNYLIEHEKISKRNLIEAPFTLIHPKGIRGVFSPEEIKEILKITEELVA
jgi:type I restriction enzyme R subunit